MHFLNWFFQAAAHYISMPLLRIYAKNKMVIFLCGAPRSGTSWASDVLSYYFNLPRPKHFLIPILFESVFHTHVILNPKKYKGCFYVIRDGRDAYVSRYYKIRDDIRNGKKVVGHKGFLKVFKDISKDENISYNVMQLMKYDLKQSDSLFRSNKKVLAFEKQYDATVLRYEDALANPLEAFEKAITSFSGSCDRERLEKVLDLQSKESQRKMSASRRSTNINKSGSSWTDVLDEETLKFYEDNISS